MEANPEKIRKWKFRRILKPNEKNKKTTKNKIAGLKIIVLKQKKTEKYNYNNLKNKKKTKNKINKNKQKTININIYII